MYVLDSSAVCEGGFRPSPSLGGELLIPECVAREIEAKVGRQWLDNALAAGAVLQAP